MSESLPHGVDFGDKILNHFLRNDSVSILRQWVVIVGMWQIMAGPSASGCVIVPVIV